jgi:peptidoglycan hydrolase-like protein with peptidoglycan-binding domain
MKGKGKGCLLLIVFLLIVGAVQSFNNNQSTPVARAPVPDVVTEFTAEPKTTTLQRGGWAVTVAPTATNKPLLIVSPTPDPTPAYKVLSSGDSGEAVVALQERLVDLGYAVGKADGEYGAKTVSAVKMIQALTGLEVTGIADDQTQRVIWGYDAPTAQPKPTKINPTPTPELEDNGEDYILNKNTKKFHYPWCSAVDQMKESNKIYFHGTSAQAQRIGYMPCKRCNP